MTDIDKLLKDNEQRCQAYQDQLAKSRALLKRLCDIEEGLTDWEMAFIDSVAQAAFELDSFLSTKQWAVVNKILDEKG